MGLSRLGEFGLIDLIKRDLVCNPGGIHTGPGDDAAVLSIPNSDKLLLTTDMLVEDVHFSFSFGGYFDVGYKAMSVNVSDIAAMGGVPAYALVSVAVPSKTTPDDITELYSGINRAAKVYDVSIVGGDTVFSKGFFTVNIALLGMCLAENPILRSGAKAGDIICITGSLGAAAAGLYVKENPGKKWPERAKKLVERAYLRPNARVNEGKLLAGMEGVTAMIDVSDGLAGDLTHLCRSSGVGCLVKAEDIPVAGETREVGEVAGVDCLPWALHGGEDFELLFTVNPKCLKGILESFNSKGCDFQQIGTVRADRDVLLQRPDGARESIAGKGYDHFRKSLE